MSNAVVDPGTVMILHQQAPLVMREENCHNGQGVAQVKSAKPSGKKILTW
jgi:hypothetical protein